MVEGGPIKVDKQEFTECWKISRKNPYIMKLSFAAGIAGLLFGYDTGVISGALLYIKEDFEEVGKSTFLQELIVSTCVAGAIIGAAVGGYANDRFGRRKTILAADVLFFIGSIIMAIAPVPAVIILGRVLVGLGVGMASMTAPLYISEASPAKIRGAMVSMNGLLITGGQFLSYLINLAFTKAPGTWRWMLGVAGIPALVQFMLMWSLPESPRWLYRENYVNEAKQILEKLYPEEQLEAEIQSLKNSVENDKAIEESIGKDNVFKNPVVRRGLYAGITVQVAQQFVGINTVMYYAPTIVQFAGFASKSVALALSLITAGLNAVGSIISMMFVDRYGRKRLMIVSMIGIIVFLVLLSVVFMEASSHARCPSKFGILAVVLLGLYIISYSPGMGTAPWIVNSEIYPLRYRGICGGIAAVANWVSNLIVSESYLTLTEHLGAGGTFLLFAGVSTVSLCFIFWFVPETKGLQFEEVERLLADGYNPCGNRGKKIRKKDEKVVASAAV
ncbi:Inositol transporter 4 [Linum perenne]